MLVKEVNDREGRLFGKFSGVGAKGTKLKETAWEEVASMINRFVYTSRMRLYVIEQILFVCTRTFI
jgi:hypothetical protein